MGALNSFALWGTLGAIGVAVPIIIHLLYRKHRRQTDWAAMELLRRALVIRSGQVKLEDYLVLFLRCLALLLLALALLRPTMNSDSTSWLGEKRVGMVIAIDASYSMNHGEHSRFERAIDKARDIVKSANEGDPVSIVLMSNRPEVLLRGAGYVPSEVEGLLDTQESATEYRLSLGRNIELLEELVSELKTPGKECYLITDSQELDWGSLAGAERASLERLTESANVFVIPAGMEGEENLSLERLAFSSGTLRPSHVATFSATVRNTGRRASSGGTVEFFVNERLSKKQTIGAIEPGAVQQVFFNTTLAESGDVRIKAQLSADDLADDNTRHAVVQVQSAIKVLAVAGPGSGNPDAAPSGTYYATTALRPRDLGVDSEVQVAQIEAPDLALERLGDYHMVILADVPALGVEMVGRLKEFVRRGGGLMIFAGDHVEVEKYNERFGSGEDGLLPASLIGAVAYEGTESGWALAPVKSDHLLAGMVARLPEIMIDEPRFTKVMRVEAAPGSETVLTIPELGTPLLLSRDIGAGTVLLFTSSADKSWNDLPNQSLFSPLLNQVVTNLTNDPDALQLTTGETVDLAVSDREVGEFVSLTDPSGDSADLRVTQSGDQPVAVVDFETTGVYAIAGDRIKEVEPVIVAANVDARESNVRIVDSGALSGQLDPLGVKVISREGALDSAIKSSRRGRELAHVLLFLAVFVFVLQSILARHFTNKMARDDAPDLSATLQMSQVAAARRT